MDKQCVYESLPFVQAIGVHQLWLSDNANSHYGPELWTLFQNYFYLIFYSADKIWYEYNSLNVEIFWNEFVTSQLTCPGEFEPGKAHYSTPIFFDQLFLIRAYWTDFLERHIEIKSYQPFWCRNFSVTHEFGQIFSSFALKICCSVKSWGNQTEKDIFLDNMAFIWIRL